MLRAYTFRINVNWRVAVLVACLALTGCSHHMLGLGSSPSTSGTAPVILAITDAPPTMVSILAAKVTLTGATLNPGNVPLFSGSSTLELTRLQTDVAYLSTTAVAAGNYTSITITFANPLLTIENDTTAAIGTCAVGSICNLAPTATANLATTVSLPSFSVVAGSGQGLLLDVSLDNLLSASLGADFKAGTTISTFTPGGTGAPLVGAEDVLGQVSNVNAANKTFTLQNPTGSFSLTVDSTSTFFQFPSSVCTTSVFACLQNNQIVSVDIAVGANGTAVARNIVFEDADNSDAEIEGTITATNVGQQQFTIVPLAASAAVNGLSLGVAATVHYSVTPQTLFDVDFVHADNMQVTTNCCMFAGPADFTVGQQVAVRRNPSSSGVSITADRVRLRSTRVTGSVSNIGAPNFFLNNLPSIYSGNSVTQIEVRTSTPTILSESNAPIPFTEISNNVLASVRGPLFNVSGSRTLVASKVQLKP
jgi:hypothetical protein